MTKIVNKKTHKPTPDDVYIGRGSIFGNPFPIGEYGTRQEVIDLYREHLENKLERGDISSDDIMSLDGKNLVCYCHPKPCHGQVLIEILDLMKMAGGFFGDD